MTDAEWRAYAAGWANGLAILNSTIRLEFPKPTLGIKRVLELLAEVMAIPTETLQETYKAMMTDD